MIKINWINPLEKDIIFMSGFSKTAKETLSRFFNNSEGGIKNWVVISIDNFLKLPEPQNIINHQLVTVEKDNNFYTIFVNIKDLSKKDLSVISDVVRLTMQHNFLIIVYTTEKEFDDNIIDITKSHFKNTDITSYEKWYYTSDFTYEVKFTPPNERKDTSDYCYLLWKGTSKKEREKFWAWDIWLNGAVCKYCWDYIRSKNVHDFKMCKCWKIWVDGWSFYVRRIWNPEDYINVVEEFADV